MTDRRRVRRTVALSAVLLLTVAWPAHARSRRPPNPRPGEPAAGASRAAPTPTTTRLIRSTRSTTRWCGCRWRPRSAPRWRSGPSGAARRRATPAVVQTQIILAVVGAVIMLVVGASLARAFGIVGAANLIRYRSKIDDPKDAVVMLCALAVGLASGVGLYALARLLDGVPGRRAVGHRVVRARRTKLFDLKIKAGKDTDALRPKIEEILRRYSLKFELRTSSDEEVCYEVQVPLECRPTACPNAILKLDPEGHAAVEWAEKKKNK